MSFIIEVDPEQRRQVLADHLELARLFDLSRNGLGMSLLDRALSGVQVAGLIEEDADGSPLAPLSEAYAAWKDAVAPGQRIGVLEGLMQDYQQLYGVRTIDTATAVWAYGQDSAAQDEMRWFVEGDAGRNRPPRELWGLTADAIRESDAILDAVFHAALS